MIHRDDTYDTRSSSVFFPLSLPIFTAGEVWLVGGGPGDPGLLTLHAVNAIRQADVILYDALIDPRCLDFARADALRDCVGKRAGQSSPPQQEITERLIHLAQEKYRVLRLKGGDPFIFGRGGDEALALAQAQIPFRIVPGITAAIASAAYAGIPLTNRSINQTVTFISGHDASGQLPKSLDWQALAQGSEVLVFYMAMKHVETIMIQLMSAGRDPHDSVAFIAHATTKKQQIVTANLANAASLIKKAGLTPPVIIIIGKVVAFHAHLAWFSKLGAQSS